MQYYKNGIGVRLEIKNCAYRVVCSKLHYDKKFKTLQRLKAFEEYEKIRKLIARDGEISKTDKIKLQLSSFGRFDYSWCNNWQYCWCAIDGVRQPSDKFDDIELLATAQHWQREYTDLDIERINNSLKTLFGKELKL